MNPKLENGLTILGWTGPFLARVLISPNTWDKIDDAHQRAYDAIVEKTVPV